MLANSSNRIFGRVVAEHADQLLVFSLLFGHQVGMVSTLTHLHEQLKDVGIVVEYGACFDIRGEGASNAGIERGIDVFFFVAKVIAAHNHCTGRKAQVVSALDLGSSQHNSIQQEAKLLEGNTAIVDIAVGLNRLENFIIPPADVAHGRMVAGIAGALVGETPSNLLARTFGAIVVGKWVGLHETDQRVQLTNAVLQRGTSERPLEVALHIEHGSCSVGGSVFDVVRLHSTDVSIPFYILRVQQYTRYLVENDTVPLDLVKNRFLLVNTSMAHFLDTILLTSKC